MHLKIIFYIECTPRLFFRSCQCHMTHIIYTCTFCPFGLQYSSSISGESAVVLTPGGEVGRLGVEGALSGEGSLSQLPILTLCMWTLQIILVNELNYNSKVNSIISHVHILHINQLTHMNGKNSSSYALRNKQKNAQGYTMIG